MKINAILTKREAEIAELLAWGAAKKEVANKLYISTRTVENTARSIFEKINIQKATELCVWWFCTKFDISFDLSPVKRAIIASLILFAFTQNILYVNHVERYYRTVRNERTLYRQRNIIRRNETDFDYLLTA
ncbi:MAG: helix-turn-helix transcriptional regulator [Prevotellaceae bacterium]|jgi:DNA-binding CsgD family transcriptional regulator|nr:helix-turn-helix transcriptional regulator [Prevotellaceae bacterium]